MKAIAGEQWDEYQLRCIAIGGNPELYRICTEYKIEKLSLREKTEHDAVKWYRKYHQAKCDSLFFNKSKPAKNFEERMGQVAK